MKLFVPQQSVNSQTYQTWHGDTGGSCHFYTTKTFLHLMYSFATGGENLQSSRRNQNIGTCPMVIHAGNKLLIQQQQSTLY